MDGARAGRTAGLARAVLERARRRRERERAASAPEEDSERLSAAFASVMSFMAQATRECESYYSLVPACRRREHEVKHICRYHGRQAGGEEPEPSLDRKSAASAAPSQAGTCQHRTKKASKDIYIEVSPGIYSITATSEDMEKQTHVVDVSAGQSIDLTFVL
ncbi:A-kinase-interacting protein 1 isoform X1 [Gallus gallus]|uniref:A-kinase-interacting protein 1 isoform X1 n=1 Tax=Gallus gallus TaxID=9031 RepID=UPI001AE697C7|nr:A-kinase-interacting protein 1 isoform X1 [Gallus gallus]XP_420987.4 A-kinase-interacting protein 1 isoform X1 [Gallus gallus]